MVNILLSSQTTMQSAMQSTTKPTVAPTTQPTAAPTTQPTVEPTPPPTFSGIWATNLIHSQYTGTVYIQAMENGQFIEHAVFSDGYTYSYYQGNYTLTGSSGITRWRDLRFFEHDTALGDIIMVYNADLGNVGNESYSGFTLTYNGSNWTIDSYGWQDTRDMGFTQVNSMPQLNWFPGLPFSY